MRSLLLLRGAPGSGKSTWIRENNLEQYTLSADKIRLLFQSPIMTVSGEEQICQKNDGKVWDLLFDLLDNRMARGEFTIIDATHSRIDMISQYKKLVEKHRYRVYVIEFVEDVATLLERNNKRESFKRVPEEVITNAVSRIQNQKLPGFVTKVSKEEFVNMIRLVPRDFNHFEKVVMIGDIHGCLAPLQQYFAENPYSDKAFYIFVGDYVDRGIQNYETIKFVTELSQKGNVLLLEGNHEIWIKEYGFSAPDKCKENLRSKEFLNVTLPELESKGFNQTEAREFYRRLGQYAYFTYGDKTVLVTHGGLSNLPSLLTSTDEMVRGVGKYEDSEEVDKSFVKNTMNNFLSVHGHRNIYNVGITNTERTFNLDDTIEFGGNLRILEMTKDPTGVIYTIRLIKNEIFNKNIVPKVMKNENLEALTDEQIVKRLLLSNDIEKKEMTPNIYSFNFRRDVFYDKKWNTVTTKARGLFIDIDKNKIVARSYDKFFNIGERDETTLSKLGDMKYPVTLFRKENGFLGILSVEGDNFFIASKTTTQGDYVGYFKAILTKKNILTEDLKNYIKEKNVTLVFEVIDPINDPHIIDYKEEKIILLDIIDNKFQYHKLPFEDLQLVASKFGIECKTKVGTLKDHASLNTWFSVAEAGGYDQNEGYVIEDQNGFMVKYKTPYYRKWKQMRSIKETLSKGRNVRLSGLTTPESNEFYSFIKSMSRDKLLNTSIIKLREEFEKR